MMTFRKAAKIHTKNKGISFFPSNPITFTSFIITTGKPNHRIPVMIPTKTPFTGLSKICNFIVFFSAIQKISVKAMMDNSGVISAHSLHIAGLSELDKGNTADNIAHPRKKHIHSIQVITTLFKSVSSVSSFK